VHALGAEWGAGKQSEDEKWSLSAPPLPVSPLPLSLALPTLWLCATFPGDGFAPRLEFWARGMDAQGEDERWLPARKRGVCPGKGMKDARRAPRYTALPPPCARTCTVNWKAASCPGTSVSE
jgi:hypothetical protein